MSNPQQINDRPIRKDLTEDRSEAALEITELDADQLEDVSGGGDGTAVALAK